MMTKLAMASVTWEAGVCGTGLIRLLLSVGDGEHRPLNISPVGRTCLKTSQAEISGSVLKGTIGQHDAESQLGPSSYSAIKRLNTRN